MLWRSEIKKLLLTQKGLLILAVCLILKCGELIAVPEQKDSRILLSQKQYDKYLFQLYGENTPEKSHWILAEYADCKEIKGKQQAMQEKYAAGELTEEEWTAFAQALNQAELHINSAQLFAEKAEQFASQDPAAPPAHYIYEYGWQTVFGVQKLPDLFFLAAVLLLAAQSISSEASSGMLPVLLAAKNGRKHLFLAKLSALLAVCLGGGFLSGLMEAGIFYSRGFLNDCNAPLYSITLFSASCPLALSLGQGYALSLLGRTWGALLLAGSVYALSVWLKSVANLLFAVLCILILPLLLFSGSPALLFTHIGLLSGSRMLLLWGSSGMPPFLPASIVTLFCTATLYFALGRYCKGL